MANEILVLEENVAGMDYIVGDIHGSSKQLRSLIEEIKLRNDETVRLIIAGDLTDKGKESFEVIRTIRHYNQQSIAKRGKQQIYVARGNHENIFLDYYDARKKFVEMPASGIQRLMDDFENKCRQMTMIPQYAYSTKIRFNHYMLNHRHLLDIPEFANVMEFFPRYIDATHFLFINGGGWTLKLSEDKLKMVAEFYRALPYVIYVEGEKNRDFYVVHADLPLSHRDVQAQIKKNMFTLTADQKFYATWARQEVIADAKITRDENDPDTFCGHNILGGVRSGSNHINLDVGTYLNKSICRISHSRSQGRFCNILVSPSNTHRLVHDFGYGKTPPQVAKEINAHFKQRAGKENTIPLLLDAKADPHHLKKLESIYRNELDGHQIDMIELLFDREKNIPLEAILGCMVVAKEKLNQEKSSQKLFTPVNAEAHKLNNTIKKFKKYLEENILVTPEKLFEDAYLKKCYVEYSASAIAQRSGLI